MNINQIISMIDDRKIESLGQLHKVDKVNTKLTGCFILKVLTQSALEGRPMSLRTIETLTKNNKRVSSYLKSTDLSQKKIDHSSLGKRLKTINSDFFKDIYEDLVAKFHTTFSLKKSVHIFDSTPITLSGKLLKNGLNLGGTSHNRYIKLSVSLKNSIPSSVRFCHNQSEASEDIALAAAINEAKIQKDDILLFDRGIAKAETFDNLTREEKFFVTRVNLNRKYRLLSSNRISKYKDDDLTIISDENIHLYNKKGEEINCHLRLIKAKKRNSEEIWFLSNLFDLSTHDITLLYKLRWNIEVLFKFLKQHLQFKKFMSYDQNGMKVYLYCLLIAAILFIIYKIHNQLTGYKIALLQFSLDLNKSIIKDIVLFCGGNPDLVDQRL